MATVTPNFNWPVPTSTDLVKDGATAIEALGDSIDASLVDLKGGTTGQVLAKQTNTDMDFVWVAQDDSNAIQNSIVDAKGDLISATANDTPARLAVGNNGETLVADSSTSTGLRYQTSANGNYLINGGMDIWQRGTTFTSTGNSLFGADRWKFQTSSNGVMSQETSDTTNGFRYALKYAAGASNTYLQMGQQIEFQQCENLQNQTVVFSFWAKALNSNAGSTALTFRTRTLAGIDGLCLFAGSNTDTSITLTTSWVRYSVTRTFTTFGSMSVEFVLGSHVSGDGFLLVGTQAEQGSVATTFKKSGGTLQGELAACQRYYTRASANGGSYRYLTQLGSAISTTQVATGINLPVSLRDVPSAVDFTTLAVTADNGSVAAVSAVSLSGASSAAVPYLIFTSTGLTQFRPYWVIANNSSSSFIGLSAEL